MVSKRIPPRRAVLQPNHFDRFSASLQRIIRRYQAKYVAVVSREALWLCRHAAHLLKVVFKSRSTNFEAVQPDHETQAKQFKLSFPRPSSLQQIDDILSATIHCFVISPAIQNNHVDYHFEKPLEAQLTLSVENPQHQANNVERSEQIPLVKATCSETELIISSLDIGHPLIEVRNLSIQRRQRCNHWTRRRTKLRRQWLSRLQVVRKSIYHLSSRARTQATAPVS